MGTRSQQARLRIREEMERKKLSQREVADLLGWSQSRVAKLLTGRVELGVDDLESLAFAVGISVTEAIRDRGMEFCADMTPTEMRLLELLRKAGDADRDAVLQLLGGKSAKMRMEERRAAPTTKPARKNMSGT